MNCAQIRYGVAIGGLDEPVPTAYSDRVVLSWINAAYYQAWHYMRLAREDYFRVQMRSTDAVQTIRGYAYNPASLALVSGTRAYTLPPDFSELKSIRCITSGRQQILFSMGDESNPDWIDSLVKSETNTTWISEWFRWAVVGDRTLVFSPIPREALDIELTYNRRLGPMFEYSTGTITRSGPSLNTIAGTSTTWTDSGIVAGMELLAGVSSRAAIDPNFQYPVVATVTSNTALTTQLNYMGVTDPTPIPYILASVPEVPEPYHPAMVEYAITRGKAKDRHPDKAFWASLAKDLFGNLEVGAEHRQISDPRFAEGFLEGW